MQLERTRGAPTRRAPIENIARELKRSIIDTAGTMHKANVIRLIVITQEVVARDQPKVSTSGLKKIPKEYWTPKTVMLMRRPMATMAHR